MVDWSGKKVVIVGAARQGLALARYLARNGAQVTLTDQRPAEKLLAERESLALFPVRWELGGHPLSLLDGCDLLCPSGGVALTAPLVVEAVRRGIPLSNDSQIFLEAAPCQTVGITGSAGKTTTTTLVGRMAQSIPGAANMDEARPASTGRKVWVGGNIGTPLISAVEEMRADDLAVMELSSFQLEIMTRSPQVAAVLNITSNHLDRHSTMEVYTAAKARILTHQGPDGTAILGRDDPGAWALRKLAPGRLLSFGLSPLPEGGEGAFLRGKDLFLALRPDPEVSTPGARRMAAPGAAGQEIWLMSTADIRLRGEHNLLNVLAACTVAAAAGLSPEAMRSGVQGFGGVRHRLEFVRSWGGADWYNDSIATAPERSMAALRSFNEPLVLLAGGRDKDLPWRDFAALVQQRVDHLIVFGEAAGKILRALEEIGEKGIGDKEPTIKVCKTLREAVLAAARIVQPGDLVLLSPGGTSFDEFKDFEERGECFVRWVNELP